MKKAPVKIKFQNGLGFDSVNQILADLVQEYDFIDSSEPDVIVFGPYGNDVPKKGNYQRVGYYCECITPDMDICEWAFGIPREEEVNSPRYKRIQWHGLDPKLLVKDIDVEEVYSQKTKFCNFLYSNPIPYREVFFKQLSKYKRVDAPGKSMNNMPPIDEQYKGDTWKIKRDFLKPYKFTIAFESYSYPGYQTEKLYDAMQMNSIPIYYGDPMVSEVFNPKSFINAADHVPVSNIKLKSFLESNGQYSFKDYRPGTYTGLQYRVRRKLKTIAKAQKMRLQTNKFDFTPLIEKIIELDNNPELYKAILKEPWLNNNRIPALSTADRWREIFDQVKN
jgi:hypothetical protein